MMYTYCCSHIVIHILLYIYCCTLIVVHILMYTYCCSVPMLSIHNCVYKCNAHILAHVKCAEYDWFDTMHMFILPLLIPFVFNSNKSTQRFFIIPLKSVNNTYFSISPLNPTYTTRNNIQFPLTIIIFLHPLHTHSSSCTTIFRNANHCERNATRSEPTWLRHIVTGCRP